MPWVSLDLWKCGKCKEVKPWSAFYIDKYRLKPHTYCYACERLRQNEPRYKDLARKRSFRYRCEARGGPPTMVRPRTRGSVTWCPQCERFRPNEDFCKNKWGYKSRCRECYATEQRITRHLKHCAPGQEAKRQVSA